MNSLFDTLAHTLTVWATTRAAGLTAYMLLFVCMTAGLLQGSPRFKGARKAKLNLIHQWTGWFGLLFGVVHGLVLTYDDYVGYTLLQVLVPFTADYEPFWTGLGTLSFYAMLLLVASSDFMKKLGRKAWRAIHFLALPCYASALLHGILLGSDSGRLPITLLYAVTGVTVVVLTILRIMTAVRSPKKKAKAAPPRLNAPA